MITIPPAHLQITNRIQFPISLDTIKRGILVLGSTKSLENQVRVRWTLFGGDGCFGDEMENVAMVAHPPDDRIVFGVCGQYNDITFLGFQVFMDGFNVFLAT